MINIAYIIQSWHIGGIETCIYCICKYLSDVYENDFTFHFIATDNPEIHPRYNKIGRAIYLGQNWNRISSYLVENKIDIVQYGNRTEYKLAALNAGIKTIIERISGQRSVNTDHSNISHMICSSSGIVELIKNYDGPTSVIKNGIKIQKNIEQDRLKFNRSDFIVVYPAARMGDGQAYDHLIKATIIAHNKNKNIKLVLMGGKPNQKGYPNIKPKLQLLSKPLKENCIFTGFVLDPLPIISGANLCVVPAKSHGISNALIEAASLSKPIIATNVGQTNEICFHGVNGYLINVGDTQTLAKYIYELSISPQKCHELGQNGLKIVEKDYNISVQAEKYNALYKSF